MQGRLCKEKQGEGDHEMVEIGMLQLQNRELKPPGAGEKPGLILPQQHGSSHILILDF
jgi:hypothetical protein